MEAFMVDMVDGETMDVRGELLIQSLLLNLLLIQLHTTTEDSMEDTEDFMEAMEDFMVDMVDGESMDVRGDLLIQKLLLSLLLIQLITMVDGESMDVRGDL